MERQATYARARDVFKKIFEGENEYRPWMELILQNTLHAFIENQDYTLAEVPLFLDAQNVQFRAHIIGNIKHNRNAAYFWQQELGRPRREQQERMDAALTRISALLGDPYVAHIVSQKKTTVNFGDIMDERKIFLVKLSRSLPPDTLKFIGTIILSEFLHAVTRREEGKKHQFCVFVDEVQNFVSSEDFATLITEARKYGIATTIAHQERYGQLADNRKIAGATLATVNKLFFQLSVKDASEVAPEVAKEPPTVTRYEREVVPSSRPYEDLLIGHSNPKIRRFVNSYLRPIQERIEDVEREMDAERLERVALLDEAALASVEERLIRFNPPAGVNASLRQDALIRAQAAQEVAADKTERIRHLHQWATDGRLSIRFLNKLFTAVMYGALVPRPGNEDFSAFLIRFVRSSTATPVEFSRFNPMDLYIQLTYGEDDTPREVQLEFAEKHGLFAKETTEVRAFIATVKQRERDEIWQYNWEKCQERFTKDVETLKAAQKKHYETVFDEISNKYWNGPYRDATNTYYITENWRISDLMKVYIYYHEFPEVRSLFAPLLIDRIDEKDHPTNWFTWVRREWELLREETDWQIEEGRIVEKRIWREQKSFLKGAALKDACQEIMRRRFQTPYFQLSFFDAFLRFVETYKEGALTILYLLKMFESCGPGNVLPKALPITSRQTNLSQPEEDRYERYPGLHTLYFIRLERHDALFVLKTYLALNNILVKGNIPARCGKYYWVGCDIDPYKLSGIRDYSLQAASDGMPMPFPPVWNEKPIWEAKLAASESRPDFQRLDELIHTLENDFEASVNVFQRSLKIPTSGSGFLTPIPSWWDTIDRVIKTYLKLRVCDLVKYGWRIADWTYPQPKVPDVANEDVERLVTALKTKFHRAEVSRRQEEEKAYLDIRKNFYIPEAVNSFIISRDHDIKKCGYWPYVVNDKNIIYLPKYTPLRVLTAPEREDLKQACLQEILGYEGGYFGRRMIEALEEFVEFLELLTHPDNQVRTLSAQYKEIRVPSRSRRDMWDEMAEELSRLPFYTAYVKVLQLGSEQSGFIQKMRTVALPPLPQGTTEKLRVDLRRKFAVDRTHVRYCRERGAIEEEIRQRQERWRRPEGRKTAAQRPSNRASRPVSPPGFPDPQQGSEEPPPPTRS